MKKIKFLLLFALYFGIFNNAYGLSIADYWQSYKNYMKQIIEVSIDIITGKKQERERLKREEYDRREREELEPKWKQGHTNRTVNKLIDRQREKINKELEIIINQKKQERQEKQEFKRKQERLIPTVTAAGEGLQNNGPLMNGEIPYTTADKHVYSDNFFGIFHGKLGNRALAPFATINYQEKENPRESLLRTYKNIISKERSGTLYATYSPEYLAKGVMACYNDKYIALAIGTTFGACIIRYNEIIYAYQYDDKNPSKDMIQLKEGDYLLMLSPGVLSAYTKKDAYTKIVSQWKNALAQSDSIVQKMKTLEQEITKASNNNLKAHLENTLRKICPYNNQDLVLHALEIQSDTTLRVALYTMLENIGSLNPNKNVSAMVLRINKPLLFQSPLILGSAEVNDFIKNKN